MAARGGREIALATKPDRIITTPGELCQMGDAPFPDSKVPSERFFEVTRKTVRWKRLTVSGSRYDSRRREEIRRSRRRPETGPADSRRPGTRARRGGGIHGTGAGRSSGAAAAAAAGRPGTAWAAGAWGAGGLVVELGPGLRGADDRADRAGAVAPADPDDHRALRQPRARRPCRDRSAA